MWPSKFSVMFCLSVITSLAKALFIFFAFRSLTILDNSRVSSTIFDYFRSRKKDGGKLILLRTFAVPEDQTVSSVWLGSIGYTETSRVEDTPRKPIPRGFAVKSGPGGTPRKSFSRRYSFSNI